MAKGRKTGGRQKGSLNKATLAADQELEAMRELVKSRLAEMVDAQIEHARGVGYMTLRRPDGSYARATDEKQVDAALAAGETTFKLYTQAPNTQAFTALMDRTFGKPPERVEVTGADGEPLKVQINKPW